MRRLSLLFFVAVLAGAATAHAQTGTTISTDSGAPPMSSTIGNFPTCNAAQVGARRVATDAFDSTTCAVGGGANQHTCECQGTTLTWVKTGTGGGGSGDMSTATYDQDTDGKVDEAETLAHDSGADFRYDVAGGCWFSDDDGSGTRAGDAEPCLPDLVILADCAGACAPEGGICFDTGDVAGSFTRYQCSASTWSPFQAPASDVTVVAQGGITSTDVQAALEELQSEIAASGTTVEIEGAAAPGTIDLRTSLWIQVILCTGVGAPHATCAAADDVLFVPLSAPAIDLDGDGTQELVSTPGVSLHADPDDDGTLEWILFANGFSVQDGPICIGLAGAAGACLSYSTPDDRFFHDANINGTKEAGEQWIDEVVSVNGTAAPDLDLVDSSQVSLVVCTGAAAPHADCPSAGKVILTTSVGAGTGHDPLTGNSLREARVNQGETGIDYGPCTLADDGSRDCPAHATDGDAIVLKEGADDGSDTWTQKVPDSGLTGSFVCQINANGQIDPSCAPGSGGGAADLFDTSNAVVIPDSGDGSAATLTHTPVSGAQNTYDCQDADGCELTIDETPDPGANDVAAGIQNEGTNPITVIGSSEAVFNLPADLVLDRFESIIIRRVNARWTILSISEPQKWAALSSLYDHFVSANDIHTWPAGAADFSEAVAITMKPNFDMSDQTERRERYLIVGDITITATDASEFYDAGPVLALFPWWGNTGPVVGDYPAVDETMIAKAQTRSTPRPHVTFDLRVTIDDQRASPQDPIHMLHLGPGRLMGRRGLDRTEAFGTGWTIDGYLRTRCTGLTDSAFASFPNRPVVHDATNYYDTNRACTAVVFDAVNDVDAGGLVLDYHGDRTTDNAFEASQSFNYDPPRIIQRAGGVGGVGARFYGPSSTVLKGSYIRKSQFGLHLGDPVNGADLVPVTGCAAEIVKHVDDGTADADTSAGTLEDDAVDFTSACDGGSCDGYLVRVVGGTGVGQEVEIQVSANQSATVAPDFSPVLDATSVYDVTYGTCARRDDTVTGLRVALDQIEGQVGGECARIFDAGNIDMTNSHCEGGPIVFGGGVDANGEICDGGAGCTPPANAVLKRIDVSGSKFPEGFRIARGASDVPGVITIRSAEVGKDVAAGGNPGHIFDFPDEYLDPAQFPETVTVQLCNLTLKRNGDNSIPGYGEGSFAVTSPVTRTLAGGYPRLRHCGMVPLIRGTFADSSTIAGRCSNYLSNSDVGCAGASNSVYPSGVTGEELGWLQRFSTRVRATGNHGGSCGWRLRVCDPTAADGANGSCPANRTIDGDVIAKDRGSDNDLEFGSSHDGVGPNSKMDAVGDVDSVYPGLRIDKGEPLALFSANGELTGSCTGSDLHWEAWGWPYDPAQPL